MLFLDGCFGGVEANVHVQGELKKVLAGAVSAVGLLLWGAEIRYSGRHGTLVVYIDAEQGVTIADCEKASKQISAILDVEQPSMADYSLEVSSPGMFRPLFTPDQFARFVGESIKIRLKEATAVNRKNFAGTLLKVNETTILLKVDEEDVEFGYDEIAQAHLNPTI